MKKELENLKEQIEKETYKKKLDGVVSFGGAGLIVTHEGDKRQADVVVYTKHEKELSWLVYELANVYKGQIDSLNKYEFYPSIGKLANEYITKYGDDNINEMMVDIVNRIEW